MIGLAIGVALATFLAGLAGAAVVGRLPSLRLRIAGLAIVASIVPLVGVLGSGVAMFESGHDTTLVLVAAAASLAALAGALLLARSILQPIAALGTSALAMGAGDLTARAATGGPAELAELGRSFNRMAVDLEALFDARRELVAWASHDLRTPLAALQAMIEAVEDGLAPADGYLAQMRAQVGSLGAIVDDLIELAVIDAGALAIDTTAVPLDLLVPERVRAFAAEATAGGVALTSRVDDEPAVATCAPELVDRVLANLVSNAIRHTPAGGTVEVVVTRAGPFVEVVVSDTGSGIAAEDLERVFEPFFRADRARAGRGSGLGMAIARGLVEAQGGTIVARRRVAGGTVVAFTLPAGAARAEISRVP